MLFSTTLLIFININKKLLNVNKKLIYASRYNIAIFFIH